MAETWPTYLLLAIYILAMIGVTIHANRKNRKDVINAETRADAITSHFLASKNFGSILLLLTTFASVFSGICARIRDYSFKTTCITES